MSTLWKKKTPSRRSNNSNNADDNGISNGGCCFSSRRSFSCRQQRVKRRRDASRLGGPHQRVEELESRLDLLCMFHTVFSTFTHTVRGQRGGRGLVRSLKATPDILFSSTQTHTQREEGEKKKKTERENRKKGLKNRLLALAEPHTERR